MAISADAYFLVVRQLRQHLLELGALIAHGRSTLAAMMLPIDQGKLALANVAEVYFGVDPDRSLGALQLVDPKEEVVLLQSLVIKSLILRKFLSHELRICRIKINESRHVETNLHFNLFHFELRVLKEHRHFKSI